jgi:hypothetical protein
MIPIHGPSHGTGSVEKIRDFLVGNKSVVAEIETAVKTIPDKVTVSALEKNPPFIVKVEKELTVHKLVHSPEVAELFQVSPLGGVLAVGWHDPAGVASATLIGENAEWETEQWHTAQVKYDGLNKNLILGDHFHLFALKMEVGTRIQVAGGISALGDVVGIFLPVADFRPAIVTVIQLRLSVFYSTSPRREIIGYGFPGHGISTFLLKDRKIFVSRYRVLLRSEGREGVHKIFIPQDSHKSRFQLQILIINACPFPQDGQFFRDEIV